MPNPDIARTADVTSMAAHVKKVDKQARRVMNRGLTAHVMSLIHSGEVKPIEFTANDVFHVLDHGRWPSVRTTDIASILSGAARKGDLVRVGGLRSGLYRRDMQLNLPPPRVKDSDIDVLESALSALAEIESVVRRYQRVITKLQAAGIRIEEE